MGIDHSNPYIHSTTVLCDIYIEPTDPLPRINCSCMCTAYGTRVGQGLPVRYTQMWPALPLPLAHNA